MFVFILSNLPLPLVLYLNWRVTTRYLQVRKLSRNMPVDKPRRLKIGWWLANISTIFVLVPILTERTLLIQDRRWLISFAIAATLTIVGLSLMNSALGQELRDLKRPGRRKKRRKPVDTAPSDTL
jgi:hypothetical protein